MECLEAPQPPNAVKEAKKHNPAIKQQSDGQSKEQLRNCENLKTFMGTRYLLNCFRFLGVYMPRNKKVLYVGWSFIVNMLVTVYLPVAFFMSFMTTPGEEFQMGNFLTSLQAAINDLACAAKIISMAFLLPKLLTCESILRRLDKRCRTQEELDSIKGFIKKGNRIVVLFAICYGCYTSSTCISALIFHRLPYNIYNPLVDSKASNIYFYVAVFIEALLVNLAICQQVASDSYPVIYVSMLRTHVGILLKRIGNLNNNAAKSLDENFEELKMCIIDHKNIIEIYNIVAPVISTTIFIQFTVTAAILCTILINILIFATDFASMVASCFYVLAVTVEIFPLCYYAQCLMDESNSLPDVLFHSNWVDQDVRYRKMLIFFIHRSQRTIEFTAGKLIPITLNSFVSIAKFSFSLYTFINKMGLKEKFAD